MSASLSILSVLLLLGGATRLRHGEHGRCELLHATQSRTTTMPPCTQRHRPCAPLLPLLVLLYVTLPSVSSQQTWRCPRKGSGALAFAAGGGGFGTGFGSAKQKPGSDKSDKSKRQKLGGLAKEIESPSPQIVDSGRVDELASSSNAPELDKWGLPIPTEEDLFPPLSDGTKLVPVQQDESTTLKDIQLAMKDHLLLDLHRFNESCLEKSPRKERTPMKISLLHRDPPVLSIENFMTSEECEDAKSALEKAMEVGSKTFSSLATSKRTSTSWFCHYRDMAVLLAKARYMLGIPIDQMEEPQVVRYRRGEEFTWHYDEVPQTQLENGGQRVATLLVYLNSVNRGGGTIFRDLKNADGSMLTMKPEKGSALLFFPAYRDGHPDDRTLHKGEPAGDEKWITQMWIHEKPYNAVVPPGNSHEAAQNALDVKCAKLGYE